MVLMEYQWYSFDSVLNRIFFLTYILKISRIRETPNFSTDADSSTDIFVSADVKKG